MTIIMNTSKDPSDVLKDIWETLNYFISDIECLQIEMDEDMSLNIEYFKETKKHLRQLLRLTNSPADITEKLDKMKMTIDEVVLGMKYFEKFVQDFVNECSNYKKELELMHDTLTGINHAWQKEWEEEEEEAEVVDDHS